MGDLSPTCKIFIDRPGGQRPMTANFSTSQARRITMTTHVFNTEDTLLHNIYQIANIYYAKMKERRKLKVTFCYKKGFELSKLLKLASNAWEM